MLDSITITRPIIESALTKLGCDMKEYKHSLIITNIIILVAAIAVLLAIKLHFSPLIALVNQDVSTEITQAIEIKGPSQNTVNQLAAKHHLSHLQLTDKSGDFTYIADSSEGSPLLFKLLFPSSGNKVDIQTSSLSINFINSFQTIADSAVTLFYQLLFSLKNAHQYPHQNKSAIFHFYSHTQPTNNQCNCLL